MDRKLRTLKTASPPGGKDDRPWYTRRSASLAYVNEFGEQDTRQAIKALRKLARWARRKAKDEQDSYLTLRAVWLYRYLYSLARELELALSGATIIALEPDESCPDLRRCFEEDEASFELLEQIVAPRTTAAVSVPAAG